MITSRTGVAATVTPGGRGQFDVVLDGTVIWSKQARGRFPEDDEIVSALT